MSLVYKALQAFKWSLLGEIVSRAIGPLVFLVLARILVPEDFGIVAAAMVIISFSQVFSDAGLSKALIHRQDRAEDIANVVFWLNVALGLIIVVILFFSSPFIAYFFHDERIAPVVRVLSLQILVAMISSVHAALMQKDLNFKQLFWVRLIATTAPGLASIPMAITGMSYWAIVAGSLVGQAVQSVTLWRLSTWRPRWTFDWGLAKELVAFGKWVMLSGLLGWFYSWMDAIVVGRYLGAHDMGLYRTGNTFVTMIFGLIFSPLLPVLYSLFSQTQCDLPKLRDALGTVAHAIALIAFPVGFFLFVLGDQIADVFFGLHWLGVEQVIRFMALTHTFAWIVGANGEIYRAMGKPNIETWAMLVMLFIYLICYLIAVQHGLVAFLEARLGLSVVAFIAHLVVARYVLGFPIYKWFFPGILITSIASAMLVSQATFVLDSVAIELVLKTLLFAAIAFFGTILFERSFVTWLWRICRHASRD